MSPSRIRSAIAGRRRAGARRPTRRAGSPRAGPCRSARRPDRPGRRRRATGRHGGAARGWRPSRRSARPRGARRRWSAGSDGIGGSSYGGGAEVLTEQPGLVPRLPGRQRAPAHAEVALDRPRHRASWRPPRGTGRRPPDRGVRRSARRSSPRRCRRPRRRSPDSAASTSTPVSTRSGVAPCTIAVKSARELSPLPPMTCSRNISRIARRAGSGASTPIRGTTLSVTTTSASPDSTDHRRPAPRRCRRRRPDRASRCARAGGRPRGCRPRRHRRCHRSAAPRRGGSSRRSANARPRVAAEHGHHLAAAGQRDPAAGLGRDELLVADHRDPQSTTGRGAREHLGVRRRWDARSPRARHGTRRPRRARRCRDRWSGASAVASSSPVSSSTSAALVKVEPTSTHSTAEDGARQPACVTT